MIKKVLYKIWSVLLAFLVLFSTFSFTVEKHFCGDELVDVAIFSHAKKCGSEMSSSSKAIFKKPCCKDDVKLIKGQDELKLNTSLNINFNKILLVAVLQEFDYVNLFESLPKQTIRFKDYSPPNLVSDICILDQVFLI